MAKGRDKKKKLRPRKVQKKAAVYSKKTRVEKPGPVRAPEPDEAAVQTVEEPPETDVADGYIEDDRDTSSDG